MINIILKFTKYLVVLYFIALFFMPLYVNFIPGMGNFPVVYLVAISFYQFTLMFAVKKLLSKNYLTSIILSGVIMMALSMFIPIITKLIRTFVNNDKTLVDIAGVMLYFILFLPQIIGLIMFFKDRKKKKKNFGEKSIKLEEYNYEEAFVFNQNKVIITNPYRGIYIQGGAGSGKSESLIKPIIKQSIENRYTGILYDFKSPELTQFALDVFSNTKTDVKPYNIDFKNPKFSNRVNVLDPRLLLKSSYALEYSEAILNNLLPETIKNKDFFVRSARSVLAGVIWWLKQEHPNYCTLPHAISLILYTDIQKLINEIVKNNESAGMVVSVKQAIDNGADRQIAAVLSTLQDSLAQISTPDIFWILSGNDFDMNINDPFDPKYLIIGNESTLSDTYAPVISLLISVATRIMNQPDKQKSIIILDEAPTLYIPRYEQIPATGRSNKIATVFSAQDYSQIIDRYGEDKASVIISNLNNQFYGRTINHKSAQNISTLFSKSDKVYISKSTGTGSSGEFVHFNTNNNKGKSESIQERDRVKVSDIIHMNAGSFYGFIAEGKPTEFLNMPFDLVRPSENKHSRTEFEIIAIKDNFNTIIEESKNIID